MESSHNEGDEAHDVSAPRTGTKAVHSVRDVRAVLSAAGLVLTDTQCEQLNAFVALLTDWNEKINLISRKQTDSLWLDHMLHSLAPAAILGLPREARYLDLGTGGGLPGIPLAIAFPDSEFLLLDSIAKKITAVSAMVASLSLPNVRTHSARAEELAKKTPFVRFFDVVLARAVTELPSLVKWSRPFLRVRESSQLVVWKGGDIERELREAARTGAIISVHDFLVGDFAYFHDAEKKLVQVHFHHDNQ